MGLYGDHSTLILKRAVNQQVSVTENRDTKSGEHIWLHDYVGDASLVFQTKEHESLRGSRLLAADHRSRNSHTASI